MKKITVLISVFLIFTMFYSCKSKKEITKIDEMTEIKIPMSGIEYESDKNYFRAKQVGESSDISTAKKIAEQNAKSELAGNIEAIIKRTTDQYTNQRSVGNKKEFENKFEEISREVVRQDLRDVKVIGEKLFKKKDGIYQYWIAVETSKETTLTGIFDGISKEAKLQLDFDKHQYEKIFNEEMKKIKLEKNVN